MTMQIAFEEKELLKMEDNAAQRHNSQKRLVQTELQVKSGPLWISLSHWNKDHKSSQLITIVLAYSLGCCSVIRSERDKVESGHQISHIAPCKVIRIPESRKFLLVESRILGIGIQNPDSKILFLVKFNFSLQHFLYRKVLWVVL